MLYKSTSLTGYKLNGLDGDIGKVKEFYFDDSYWTVRYLVADTGNWLEGRQVLITPRSMVAVNDEEQSITIDLTKKQIEDSPSLESDKPVSRQFEENYYGYYGLDSYWNDPNRMGAEPVDEQDNDLSRESAQYQNTWDPNLRSTGDMRGHNIQASDGEIGYVEDFIIEDKTWVIRYLIINTRNWWPGKKVLISPQWVERVSWTDSNVYVNMLRDSIKNSPEYSEESLITREFEADLYHHFNLKEYWVDDPTDDDDSQ